MLNGPTISPSTVLSCTGLQRSFGALKAVVDVSFEIAQGETYGLLGPNGAGKTTTISIIAGVLRADAGRVTVAGKTMTPSAMDAKRHIGLVPQDIALYPDLTARENLHFFGRIQRVAADQRASRVDEVLETIGLVDRANDRVSEFSGGMKRRLNIGVGLLHRPTLLILDEPTVGVDPQSRNAILDAVETLATDGMGVLYTTHYMEEAQRLCDRIGIVDQGTLVAEGTAAQLIGRIGADDVVRLQLAGQADRAADILAELGTNGRPTIEADTVVIVTADAPARLPGLLAALADAQVAVTGVEVRRPDLEDVFLQLTGRALRD